MHALESIHGALRPGGVLLDLHPQPRNTRVEIWRDGRVVPVGEIDLQEDISGIRRARDRLRSVERRGLFVTERRRFIELVEHYPTVEDWQEHLAREGSTIDIPDGMLDRVRGLLSDEGAELIVREPVRASRLTVLPRETRR